MTDSIDSFVLTTARGSLPTKPTATIAPASALSSGAQDRLATIVLVRHGRPALSRRVRIDRLGYVSWWAAYAESPLAPTERAPMELAELATSADLFIASPLPRAAGTAVALCGGHTIISDEVFVEAPLPSPPIPFVRLRPTTWGVLSRMFWWLGYAGKGESRRHAKIRAIEAADRLIALARGRRLIILCGHGWFNRMTRKVLRQRGWQCAYDGGDSYWAWRRYEPPRAIDESEVRA
jgi:broad specificity phosphatase PhoE